MCSNDQTANHLLCCSIYKIAFNKAGINTYLCKPNILIFKRSVSTGDFGIITH